MGRYFQDRVAFFELVERASHFRWLNAQGAGAEFFVFWVLASKGSVSE